MTIPRAAPPTDKQAAYFIALATYRSTKKAAIALGMPGHHVVWFACKAFVRRARHITTEDAERWRAAAMQT